MRNTAKQIKKKGGQELTTAHRELKVAELQEEHPENTRLYGLVLNAFYYGVAEGYKIRKAEQ